MSAKKSRRKLERSIARYFAERPSEHVGQDFNYVLIIVEDEPKPGTAQHDATLLYEGTREVILPAVTQALETMKAYPDKWGQYLNLRPDKQQH